MCCWYKHVWFYFWVLRTRAVNLNLLISKVGSVFGPNPYQQTNKEDSEILQSKMIIPFHLTKMWGEKNLFWWALLRSGLRFEWRSCHLPWSQKSPVSHCFKGLSIEGWRALKNQLYWILKWNSLEWDKYFKNSCLDAQERCVMKNSIF